MTRPKHGFYMGLLGTLALAACAPGEAFGPPPQPHPQAQIIETADATYMHPVGKPIERIVPGGPVTDPVTADRLTSLEIHVSAMQRQIDSMMPALTRLAGTEGSPQDMLGHLAQADKAAPGAATPGGPAAPPPAAVTPAPLPDAYVAAPQSLISASPAPTPHRGRTHSAAVSASAPPAGGALVIQDLRVGEHPGMTRIVLDASAKATIKTDLDNDNNILTVTVPGARWGDGTAEHKTPKSPLLASWQAGADGQGGTRFALQLRKAVKIAGTQTMAGSPTRIVIDLAGQ